MISLPEEVPSLHLLVIFLVAVVLFAAGVRGLVTLVFLALEVVFVPQNDLLAHLLLLAKEPFVCQVILLLIDVAELLQLMCLHFLLKISHTNLHSPLLPFPACS